MSTSRLPIFVRLPVLAAAALALLAAGAAAQIAPAPAPVVSDVPEPPVIYDRQVSDTLVVNIPGNETMPESQGQPSQAGQAGQTGARTVRSVQRDAGSTIEELRVGGQTQQISVQPAGSSPSYEVRPANNNTLRQTENRRAGDGTNGARVWNIKQF